MQMGQVANDNRLARQDRGREYWQRRILGSGYRKLPTEWLAPSNQKLIHYRLHPAGARRFIVLPVESGLEYSPHE